MRYFILLLLVVNAVSFVWSHPYRHYRPRPRLRKLLQYYNTWKEKVTSPTSTLSRNQMQDGVLESENIQVITLKVLDTNSCNIHIYDKYDMNLGLHLYYGVTFSLKIGG